jgi:hypothetical protein
MRQGLIEYDLTTHTYSITPRGAEILKLSEELAGYLEPIHQMIEKYSFCVESFTIYNIVNNKFRPGYALYSVI